MLQDASTRCRSAQRPPPLVLSPTVLACAQKRPVVEHYRTSVARNAWRFSAARGDLYSHVRCATSSTRAVHQLRPGSVRRLNGRKGRMRTGGLRGRLGGGAHARSSAGIAHRFSASPFASLARMFCLCQDTAHAVRTLHTSRWEHRPPQCRKALSRWADAGAGNARRHRGRGSQPRTTEVDFSYGRGISSRCTAPADLRAYGRVAERLMSRIDSIRAVAHMLKEIRVLGGSA